MVYLHACFGFSLGPHIRFFRERSLAFKAATVCFPAFEPVGVDLNAGLASTSVCIVLTFTPHSP